MPQRVKPKGGASSSLTIVSVSQAMLVEEYRSFRRAADALGIRQSAVSRAVRALEEVLGVALFERHQAGVRTTNAGAAFFAQARAAFTQLDAAAESAVAAGIGNVGQLRIGMQPSLTSGCLRALIEIYRAQYPHVQLRFCEASPVDHIAAVRMRQIDIAFCTAAGQLTGLDIYPVWSEQILVALPKGHDLTRRKDVAWPDLGDQRIIVRSLDRNANFCSKVRREIEASGRRAFIEKLDVERATLLQLVGMGLGVGLTSESTAAISNPNIVFRPITGRASTLQYSAVWLQQNDNPALRRLLSLVRSFVKKPRPPGGDKLIPALAFLVALGRRLGLST
ncbi:MAG: LysR family transcriptional regulator [Proteobacteria bacterium]|nr:MAG: LysR family transcriptional regulator [Pseudomonadota bacterium]